MTACLPKRDVDTLLRGGIHGPRVSQLLQFTDLALLCLRLLVAVVLFTSGYRHAKDLAGRAASIGLSPGVTQVLGWAEMAGALGVALAFSRRWRRWASCLSCWAPSRRSCSCGTPVSGVTRPTGGTTI